MTYVLFTILLGYPALYLFFILTGFLSRKRITPLRDEQFRPAVTIIIASAGEGADVLQTKLKNTLSLQYPPELLELILFSDGHPFPAALDRQAFVNIRFVQFEQLGKTECQNLCAAMAKGEVIVFTDITATLDSNALLAMTRWYADPRVGSVGGTFEYRFTSANAEAEYLSREIRNKALQGRSGFVTGYFGPLYSVRRSVYQPMPAFYPADLMLPIMVSWSGSLSLLDPESISYRVLDRKMEQEVGRKRRIIAQALAATLRFLREKGMGLRERPDMLSAILTRKLFRWLLAPYGLFLYLSLLSFPAVFIAVSVMLFGMIAWSGLYARSDGRSHALLAPYYGLMIFTATLLAIQDVLRGENYAAWRPGSR